MEHSNELNIIVTLAKRNWEAMISILESDYRSRGKEWIQWGDAVKENIQTNTYQVISLEDNASVALREDTWRTIKNILVDNCRNRSKDWVAWAASTTQIIQKAIDSAQVKSKPEEPSYYIRSNEIMGQTKWKNPKIFCQSCGREAQTKYVEYFQNIGAIIMRFSKRIDGYLCKECSSKYFWSFTGTTLLLGWWGIISFFVSLFIIPNNIIRYFGTLSLQPPNPATSFPLLTDAVIGKIKPYTAELFQRINAGEDFETVARSIAIRAVVSPGQVIIYSFALTQALKEKKAVM